MMTKKEFYARKAQREALRRRRKKRRILVVSAGALLTLVVLVLVIAVVKSSAKDDDGKKVPSKNVANAAPTSVPSYDNDITIEHDTDEDEYLLVTITRNRENITKVNVRSQPWIDGDDNIVTQLVVGQTFKLKTTYVVEKYGKFVGFKGSDIGCDHLEYVWISRQYVDVDEHTEPWAVNSYDFKYHEKYAVPMNLTVGRSNVRSEPYTGNEDSVYGMFVQVTQRVSKVFVSDDQQFFGFYADDFADRGIYKDCVKDPDGLVWIYWENCVLSYAQ